jgi:hypothetical protein
LDFLDLSNTRITDQGLQYLNGMTRLRILRIVETEVTDAGVAELQRALPGLKIEK